MINIKELLNSDNIAIFQDLDYDKSIENLFEMIKSNKNILDFDKFKESVLEREKIISTGIGLGIAIPHARGNFIKDFAASCLIIKNGVDWRSIDDKPVRFAFLIGSPDGSHKEYLHLLAQTFFLLKNDDIRKNILKAKTSCEIYSIICEN